MIMTMEVKDTVSGEWRKVVIGDTGKHPDSKRVKREAMTARRAERKTKEEYRRMFSF